PDEPAVPVAGQPFDGPFPAPIGVLELGAFLALVNWRNRPDEAQPLPLMGQPEPLPGSEWSVESVLSQFAWEGSRTVGRSGGVSRRVRREPPGGDYDEFVFERDFAGLRRPLPRRRGAREALGHRPRTAGARPGGRGRRSP